MLNDLGRDRDTCRACTATELIDVFSLGSQPAANAYMRVQDLKSVEPTWPLTLRQCKKCGMVQLSCVVNSEYLFREYSFVTSSSKRMQRHFADLMMHECDAHVNEGGLVVEIGSNDGTALASLRERRVRRIGIDPARNISWLAAANGVPTVAEFFTETLAHKLRDYAGPADLIVACNVMGHADDLDDFCEGVKALLSHDGTLVVEVPYLKELVNRGEFDTVYHEHLSYFSVKPLAALFRRHGMWITSIAPQDVHGGTIRVTAKRGDGYSSSVAQWINAESQEPDWKQFSKQAEELRSSLVTWLKRQRDADKTVWGYGAPAKATVTLNYCQVDTDLLPYLVDSTPWKQGLHVPGTHQPILMPSELTADSTDYALILAWNHAEEIKAKSVEYADAGGTMLTARDTLTMRDAQVRG